MSKKTELVEEIVALELAGKPTATETERDALVRKYRKMKLAELEAVYAEQSQRLADATADLVEEEPALGDAAGDEFAAQFRDEDAHRTVLISQILVAMKHTDNGPLHQRVRKNLEEKSTAELEKAWHTFCTEDTAGEDEGVVTEVVEYPDPKVESPAPSAAITGAGTPVLGSSTVVISGAVFNVPAF